MSRSDLVAIALLFAFICTAAAHAQDTPAASGAAPEPRYQLRHGDVLDLNFPFVPAFNQIIAVQPDGYVTLRALGPRRVVGLTLPELTAILRTDYSTILRDPLVTVELKEFEKPYFVVAGEVERPGKYDLKGDTTIVQAVAVAGGLKDRAKQSRAVVFRRTAGGSFETRKIDLRKMLEDARLTADLRLQPGDMLFIPKGRRVNVSALTSSLWILAYLY
jgi:polysaccharide export outer membrane protein